MKKITAIAAVLLGTTSVASAADMAVKARPMAAPPPIIYNWTGFYFGGNIGGLWDNNNDVDVVSLGVFNPVNFNPDIMNQAAAGATTRLTNGNSDARFIGGVQAGYNWQAGNWLFGLEADIQGIANNSNHLFATTSVIANNGLPILTDLDVAQKLNYLGTVRGRLGFLASPTFLLYGTGGLAYGEVELAIAITQTHVANLDSAGALAARASDTRVGWTAGVGGEWLFAPQWSAKFEWLYYDLGSFNYNAGVLNAFQTDGFRRYAISPTVHSDFTGNIVRFGVNYHFNIGKGPVY